MLAVSYHCFHATVKPVYVQAYPIFIAHLILSGHNLESLNFLPIFTVIVNLHSADSNVDTNIKPFFCRKPALSGHQAGAFYL